MGEWLPIESAPKDGTVFLAYWHDDPQFVAWIDAAPKKVVTHEGPWWRRQRVESFRPEGGWRVLMPPGRGYGFGIHGNFAPFHPSHWMPLPEPPK